MKELNTLHIDHSVLYPLSTTLANASIRKFLFLAAKSIIQPSVSIADLKLELSQRTLTVVIQT